MAKLNEKLSLDGFHLNSSDTVIFSTPAANLPVSPERRLYETDVTSDCFFSVNCPVLAVSLSQSFSNSTINSLYFGSSWRIRAFFLIRGVVYDSNVFSTFSY